MWNTFLRGASVPAAIYLILTTSLGDLVYKPVFNQLFLVHDLGLMPSRYLGISFTVAVFSYAIAKTLVAAFGTK